MKKGKQKFKLTTYKRPKQTKTMRDGVKNSENKAGGEVLEYVLYIYACVRPLLRQVRMTGYDVRLYHIILLLLLLCFLPVRDTGLFRASVCVLSVIRRVFEKQKKNIYTPPRSITLHTIYPQRLYPYIMRAIYR